MTIYQLHAAIKQWKKYDPLCQWLSHNIKLLYFISIITGSSFSAVEICTSNLYNLNIFDMPLSKTQIIQYQTNSVYSTVLFEV